MKIKLTESALRRIIKRVINERKKRKPKPVEDTKYTLWCKENGWEDGVGEGCADDALDSEDGQIRSWAIGFLMGHTETALHEGQDVLWPNYEDESNPIRTSRKSQIGNVPELHAGKEIELIKPRVKDWWRAEEILWDMSVDYDKFDRKEKGVTFLMKNEAVAFYDNGQKTLIVYATT